MLRVNQTMDQMAAKMNHERRVAVPFYRDDRKVALLQFEPAGPVIRELPLDSYDRSYKVDVSQSLETVALKLIGACRTCYLPGSRVIPTLMEIFNMTQTNGSGDLNSLSQADLTETYNKLAAAAGKGGVKGFKDKATAIARIQALQGDVAQLTPSQQKAAEAKENGDAATASKKAATKTSQPKADKPAAKDKPATKPAAKTAPAKKTAAEKPAQKSGKDKKDAGEKKPRGQGIGSYCQELILAGKTNEEVLEAVKKKFPDANTSSSSVSWYRNKLKTDGALT